MVAVLVAAEAASRFQIVVMSSPPLDFSSVFSAWKAHAYSETASYYVLVTVIGVELNAGVSLVPRRSAAES